MSQKQRADYILEYAQRELSLASFDIQPIISSTLTFITKCQPTTMTHFMNVLQQLIEMKPITPITENDFAIFFATIPRLSLS